jgi:hypothetical protein
VKKTKFVLACESVREAILSLIREPRYQRTAAELIAEVEAKYDECFPESICLRAGAVLRECRAGGLDMPRMYAPQYGKYNKTIFTFQWWRNNKPILILDTYEDHYELKQVSPEGKIYGGSVHGGITGVMRGITHYLGRTDG